MNSVQQSLLKQGNNQQPPAMMTRSRMYSPIRAQPAKASNTAMGTTRSSKKMALFEHVL